MSQDAGDVGRTGHMAEKLLTDVAEAGQGRRLRAGMPKQGLEIGEHEQTRVTSWSLASVAGLGRRVALARLTGFGCVAGTVSRGGRIRRSRLVVQQRDGLIDQPGQRVDAAFARRAVIVLVLRRRHILQPCADLRTGEDVEEACDVVPLAASGCLEVFALHAARILLVQLVGMQYFVQIGDRCLQLGWIVGFCHRQQDVFEIDHHVGAELGHACGELVYVSGADPTLGECLRDGWQELQRLPGPVVLARFTQTHAQVLARPAGCRGRALLCVAVVGFESSEEIGADAFENVETGLHVPQGVTDLLPGREGRVFASSRQRSCVAPERCVRLGLEHVSDYRVQSA